MTTHGVCAPTATVHALRARTEQQMHPAVAQAIDTIYRRYAESLVLSDLTPRHAAPDVVVNPFHLCRLFLRDTGISPGRYLTSVRLFEAKRLLLSTSMAISDVVRAVGYSGVGTFAARFTSAVGMTPSQYRDPRVCDLLVAISPHYHRLPTVERLNAARGAGAGAPGAIAIRIDVPADLPPGDLLVGVFADPVPQCAPVAFTGVPVARSGRVVLDGVPPGRWVIVAAARHETAAGSALSFGVTGRAVPVTGSELVAAHLRLRRIRPTDPPIAVSLAPAGEPVWPTSPRVAVATAA